MADNVVLNSGSGGSTAATKEVTHSGDTSQIQVVTISGITGSEGSYTIQDIAHGGGVESAALRVTIASDSTGVLSVDDNDSTLSIDDGGSNISVDWGGTAPPIGAGLEATALRVTLATDSTGVVSVDDNGGALTVDGTVTANLSATDNAVLDQIDANTDFGAVVGGGVEATALRVTIASDSTGVVSVDDNGGALTVDGTVTANLSATDNTVLDNIDTQTATIDNTIFVDDAAFTEDTSSVNVAGAVRDDEVGATAIVSTDGDAGPLRMNMFGMLKTTEIWDATSEPKYAVIDAATSGDNTLVAAPSAGIKIRILAAFMIAAGTVTARFESGASGTAMSGQMNLTTNSGFVLPYNPAGWGETADATLLNLELSAAVSVDGMLVYVLV